jgi:hypothetical protein
VVSHDVIKRIGVVGGGATGAVIFPVVKQWKVCVGLMLQMYNESLYASVEGWGLEGVPRLKVGDICWERGKGE